MRFWIFIGLAGLWGAAGPAPARGDSQPARLSIQVRDPQGEPAEALLFIKGKGLLRVVAARRHEVVLLPPGPYQISASISRTGSEGISRYSSPEASIVLASGDGGSVVLPLRTVTAPQTEVAESLAKRLGLLEAPPRTSHPYPKRYDSGPPS